MVNGNPGPPITAVMEPTVIGRWKIARKSPACRRGWYSGVDFVLRFQLSPQRAGQTDQARAQKSQAAWFGDDHVRIAAGDRCRPAEESFAGVDG